MLDKKYALSPLEKGKFVVWFEPTLLGEVTCEVTFESRVAGKYVYVFEIKFSYGTYQYFTVIYGRRK